MKVTLMRHEKSACPKPSFFLDSGSFRGWAEAYDAAGIVKPISRSGGHAYSSCYSSDLIRAVETAAVAYEGDIVTTPLLREIPLSPFTETGLKLPHPLWNAIGRFAWTLSHLSQPESKRDSSIRADEFVSHLLQNHSAREHVLVVTHGFFLLPLSASLLKAGFTGRRTARLRNGECLTYDKA
ncbi:histidine phosphatase family protein [Paenibacillus sp. MBLB4367]|uniref:histidine phosphatase family protein n=1 Tax=Paenibacillus sp. MBLB4367 TaxID=3384767 RepID=UPI0039081001